MEIFVFFAVVSIIVMLIVIMGYKSSAENWQNRYYKEISTLKQDLERKHDEIRKSQASANLKIDEQKRLEAENKRNFLYRSQQLEKKQKELDNKAEDLSDLEESLKRDQYIKRLMNDIQLYKNLSEERNQCYPWVATLLAKYQKEQNDYEASLLSSRATTSREIVRQLKSQNAELRYRCSIAENQNLLYENLFPWLEEFKTADIDSAVEYIRSTNKDEDYDAVRNWLSPEEYVKLTTAEKNQLALDRYLKRSKSDWEIGVDYERFVGYQYEMKGYRVKYIGATEGMKDMGRDLICEKNDHFVIIQCKRWSDKKTIHEKHIFQLFGSAMQMRFEDPEKLYDALFITSTKLSDLAKLCAKQLKIEVVENYQYKDYPRIKCNIGKSGEKIYHLPFDQQYDRIIIDKAKGERYATTINEAESYGFRRAFRHHS